MPLGRHPGVGNGVRSPRFSVCAENRGGRRWVGPRVSALRHAKARTPDIVALRHAKA